MYNCCSSFMATLRLRLVSSCVGGGELGGEGVGGGGVSGAFLHYTLLLSLTSEFPKLPFWSFFSSKYPRMLSKTASRSSLSIPSLCQGWRVVAGGRAAGGGLFSDIFAVDKEGGESGRLFEIYIGEGTLRVNRVEVLAKFTRLRRTGFRC